MVLFAVIALAILLTIVPVMIGARLVNAQNTGFGAAFMAMVALFVLSAVIGLFVPSENLGIALSIAGGAALFAGILGTTFLRGLVVSIVVVAIQTIVIFVLIGGMMGFEAMSP